MRDKAIGEMAEILFPLADRVIVTRADNPRSASAAEIREAASRTSTEIEEAPDVAAAHCDGTNREADTTPWWLLPARYTL